MDDDQNLRLQCVGYALRVPNISPEEVISKAKEIYEFCKPPLDAAQAKPES